MKWTPCTVLLSLALAGCQATPAPVPDIQVVQQWLCGSFSSQAQAEAAPQDYFDIRLRVVPIWTKRTDGPWLYVEQAASKKLDKPYRQRVYRLRAEGATVVSEVYALRTDPLRWAGQWKDPWAFDAIGPADLDERSGCAVVLRRVDEASFQGSTVGNGCPSELSGAAYATSEVRLAADGMTSWDRGYDAAGKQVWGATQGAYRFERQP
jgi:CpeT protein